MGQGDQSSEEMNQIKTLCSVNVFVILSCLVIQFRHTLQKSTGIIILQEFIYLVIQWQSNQDIPKKKKYVCKNENQKYVL